MAEMKTVSLRKSSGTEVARVQIESEAVGPDIIEHAGATYVRKTHDVYHEATRLIVRGEQSPRPQPSEPIRKAL